MERSLASSFVRLSRTSEDKCEADSVGASRAGRTSPTRRCTVTAPLKITLGFNKSGSRGSDVANAGEERATHGRLCRTGSDPSPGFRRFRFQAAFSLVEVLASLFILTLSAVGITAAWRLADYQELLTRVDRRAERILREYYELQTFAPPDSRPFTTSASPSPSPITGYLYYPRQIANQNGSGAFGKMVPFSISMTNAAAGTTQLVLTYTSPSSGTQASRQVTKTVVLNP
jgi:hypothetical protein